MALTLDSRLKDVYANPVGHDALEKILLQVGAASASSLLQNPLIANLRLRQLARPAGLAKIPPSFFDALLKLLNAHPEQPETSAGPVMPEWWKEAVFYQIYPRSFQDSNGDGVGDLRGIIERLDYLQGLGIDALWLSPIYDSPNDDNGYDIRDYYAIMQEFGTMADFDELLDSLHQRGMRLIMDLVVNHTSDEHPWFQKALAGDEEYQDYYMFRPGKVPGPPEAGGEPPFSGPAWNYYPELDKWALHLFSAKQMDLNWDNPALRAEIMKMVNWWLDKGVDGFRLDVINYISKFDGLPDGDETIARLMGYCGIEQYYFGPRLHEYLHELNRRAFAPNHAFSVGEAPGLGIEMSELVTAAPRQELDMVFNFDHLENTGRTRFDDYEYDLNYYKKYLIGWTQHYSNDCWMSLFYDNHDNPRMVSKVSKDPDQRERVAKLLALVQLTSKGTPFIYQGQEIGMANQKFTDMSELRDVESLNLMAELTAQGKPEAEALAQVLAGTRDHARTPMQWNDGRNAGFTTGTPWIQPDGDHLYFNVASEAREPDSVLNFYRELIDLRRRAKSALVYGDTRFVFPKRGDYLGYFRIDNDDDGEIGRERVAYFVECNLSPVAQTRPRKPDGFELLLSNYPAPNPGRVGIGAPAADLRPYEANLYRVR